MNEIRRDHCAGLRAAAFCLGAGIAMLVSTLAVYAQHPHATQHPNVGCPHGHLPGHHGHLPGHHGRDCQYGSTPFPFQAPTYNDYQHWMRDLETGPPADLGDPATQIRQINQIQERVEQAVLQIQADQEKLRQRVRAQTSWGTRGVGRNLSGPNANPGGRRSFEPGAYARLQKLLATAIEVDADEGSNYFVLAQALLATQQYRHAAWIIEFGFRLDPDWLPAGHDPQRLYKDAGEFLVQLARLAKRLQDEPRDRDALDVLGYELYQTGRERADTGGASARRVPGRQRFVFEAVLRAIRADQLVMTRSQSDSCSSQQ